MKTLWAPWRIDYLSDVFNKRKSAVKRAGACVFCTALEGKPSPDNLVLATNKSAYVVMNRYPYANAHLMVIPRRHVSDFTKLSQAEHAAMGAWIARSVAVLKEYGRCDGFNIGMNLGEAAGAGIKDHLHYHVVPRWNGDHNFMPILADVRVIPEHMEETYLKLRALFRRKS